MSIVGDIFATYRSPRRVMARRLSAASEATALMTLMAACGLVFVAQWPLMARLAHLDPSVTLEQRIGAVLLGWVFFAPLVFYALTGLIWLVLRVAGRPVSGLALRSSVFWALLAATPVWLLYGLAQGLAGAAVAAQVIGILLLLILFTFVISAVSSVLTKSASE